MKTWLSREYPPGPPIVLPHRAGAFVFGRSSKATLVFDDVGISARHCEVKFVEGFWVVRDLGSAGGTRVNGVVISYPYSLSEGDQIEFGVTRLRFHAEQVDEPEALIETLLADLHDDFRWAVYSDWLAEQGDPLAQRIMAPGDSRLDDRRFLGPLWPFVLDGSLEFQWLRGMMIGVTLRHVPNPHRETFDWQPLLHAVLENRLSRLLQHLRVDLVRLDAEGLAPAVQTLTQMLMSRRRMASLQTLHLGARFDFEGPPMWVSAELQSRFPRLTGPLVIDVKQSRLVLIESLGKAEVDGVPEGGKVLNQLARFRQSHHDHRLFVEEPPNLQLMRDGNPSFVSRDRTGWLLRSGNFGRSLTVNGVHHPTLALMAGDVIEIANAARFKLVLDP